MSAENYGRCPKCASKEIQRSRRKNIVERAIGLLVLPWRCNVCYVRFFRPFWFKAQPRRIEIQRHFGKPDARVSLKRRVAGQPALLRWSKETLPRFVKRNPAFAFFFPTRRHVRDVEDSVSLTTK